MTASMPVALYPAPSTAAGTVANTSTIIPTCYSLDQLIGLEAIRIKPMITYETIKVTWLFEERMGRFTYQEARTYTFQKAKADLKFMKTPVTFCRAKNNQVLYVTSKNDAYRPLPSAFWDDNWIPHQHTSKSKQSALSVYWCDIISQYNNNEKEILLPIEIPSQPFSAQQPSEKPHYDPDDIRSLE